MYVNAGISKCYQHRKQTNDQILNKHTYETICYIKSVKLSTGKAAPTNVICDFSLKLSKLRQI